MSFVGGRIVRKPCYGLAELCERWGVSELDIANFAIAGELTLSIVVAQLPLEEGTAEELDEGYFANMPERHFRFSGTLDLWAHDAWHVMLRGTHGVSAFRAEPGMYRSLWVPFDGQEQFDVPRERLVVRHAERERFEAEQAEAVVTTAAGGIVARTSQRGAPPKYDWDAFWGEALVSMFQDGPPATLAEYVRRMEDWFADRGEHPDSSTIKKKLSPPWRRIAPQLERRQA